MGGGKPHIPNIVETRVPVLADVLGTVPQPDIVIRTLLNTEDVIKVQTPRGSSLYALEWILCLNFFN